MAATGDGGHGSNGATYLFGVLLELGPNGPILNVGDDSKTAVYVLADLVVNIGLPRHGHWTRDRRRGENLKTVRCEAVSVTGG